MVAGPILVGWSGADFKLKTIVIGVVCAVMVTLYVTTCYIAHWITLKSVEQKQMFSKLSNKEKGTCIGGILF